jgi:hypothetical protein
MSDANRTAVGLVEEAVLGTTPANPAIEALRVKGANLAYSKATVTSKELRPDGQVPDVVTVGFDAGGDIPLEASYGALDTLFRGALRSEWVWSAIRQNTATQTGNISAVSATAYTVAASGGTLYNAQAFAQQMLIRATGFGQAGNNRLFVAAAGTTGTSVAMTGGTVEAAPPVGARLKAIGFQGASGDLTATASGLAATALNFTTLGLVPGQWLWVGGLAAGNAFATPANKGWCRVSTVAAAALTFDIVPTGWAIDAGAAKTINVYTGDYLRNGTTRRSFTVELQYQDLATPEYEYYTGMVVSTLELTVGQKAILEAKAAFMGLNVSNVTARVAGATDVAAPTNDVLNTSSNVGTMLDNGAPIPGGNFVMGLSLSITNNLRRNDIVASLATVNIGVGQFRVEGTLHTYYGSNAILQKVRNSTASSYFVPLTDGSNHAILVDLPRIKYTDGTPTVPGIDTDRMLDTKFAAMRHPTLGYTMHIQRFEEYNT